MAINMILAKNRIDEGDVMSLGEMRKYMETADTVPLIGRIRACMSKVHYVHGKAVEGECRSFGEGFPGEEEIVCGCDCLASSESATLRPMKCQNISEY